MAWDVYDEIGVGVCGSYRFLQPLVPDAGGNFALGPILAHFVMGQSGAVALRGTVSGGVLNLEYRVLTNTAETGSVRYVLTRDQPADYSHTACAARRRLLANAGVRTGIPA